MAPLVNVADGGRIDLHITLSQAAWASLANIRPKLAGRTWLEANTDSAAAFTALQATAQPPPPPELDQILARVLLDRFGLPRSQAAA